MSTDANRQLKIGAPLRAARLRKKRSQEWVALEADIDRSYLSQIENDVKSPTIDMLARVCAAIGVRVSEVVAAAEQARR